MMLNKIIRLYIACLIITLPTLSCANDQKQVMPPVKNNSEKVTLECMIPFNDAKKNTVFKNFETDVESIFPDYDIHLSFVQGDANAYNTKLKVTMYSDTPPDIFYSGDGKFTDELYYSKRIRSFEKEL